MRAAAVALSLLALAACALCAPGALANGDPPSDVLLAEDVYVPSEPAKPASIRDIKAAARRARDAGYPAKVAVVQSELDLGTLATAFGKPQEYADYLAADLRRHPDTPDQFTLLVVMPAGAGIAGKDFNGDEREAARTIDVSTNASPDRLVTAAQATLERMAAAGGKPIGGAGGSGGGGASAAVIAGVMAGLLLLAVVAIVAGRARRQASAEAGPQEEPEGEKA